MRVRNRHRGLPTLMPRPPESRSATGPGQVVRCPASVKRSIRPSTTDSDHFSYGRQCAGGRITQREGQPPVGWPATSGRNPRVVRLNVTGHECSVNPARGLGSLRQARSIGERSQPGRHLCTRSGTSRTCRSGPAWPSGDRTSGHEAGVGGVVLDGDLALAGPAGRAALDTLERERCFIEGRP